MWRLCTRGCVARSVTDEMAESRKEIDATGQLRGVSVQARSSGAGRNFENRAPSRASRFDGGDEHG